MPLRRTSCAALLAVATVALAAGSCRDIVGSGDIDAVSELCATLTDCYGPETACTDLAALADNGPASDRKAFLSNFDVEVCLGTCAGSRGCLDHDLFCADVGEACGPFDSCCGREGGLAECRRDEEARCCARDGVQCATTEDCCDSECIAGYCGGVRCDLVGVACRFNRDCCTQRCVDEVCDKRDCSSLNEPCLDVSECCEPTVLPPEGARVDCVDLGVDGSVGKTCQLVTDQQCFELGQPCDPAAGGAVACCEGLVCETAVLSGQEAFCVEGAGGCKVEGFDCAVDADCCGELVCRLDFLLSYCTAPNGCLKAGSGCRGNTDCCSGSCFSGECLQGTGTNCASDNADCHSPTQTGPVIPADCADGCVNAVKAADVFCACTEWDNLCVEAYLACSAG